MVTINQLYRSTVRQWWFILACMIAGALITGALAFRSPAYTSSARLVMSLDTSRSGMLKDVDADRLMVVVGDLIKSEPVLDQTRANFETGKQMSNADFMASASMERYDMVWTLRYADGNPQVSHAAVAAWADVAYQAIVNAQQAALAADLLGRRLESLNQCAASSAMNLPVTASCSAWNADELQTSITETISELTAARAEAFGMNSALTAMPPDEIQPAMQAAGGRGGSILIGALGGLLLGLILPLMTSSKKSDND